ncbi:MAG: hypothetical protein KF862_10185 [Chitinophagaceae bacterium]|nr:hypothetical protein [Chitinophagaceae bacterium]
MERIKTEAEVAGNSDLARDANKALDKLGGVRFVPIPQALKDQAAALIRSAINESTQFAKDPEVINAVARFLKPANASTLNNIGGVTELENIIQAANDMPCATCRNAVKQDLQGLPLYGARRMDMMLDDLFAIGQQFASKPDIIATIKSGLTHPLSTVREGSMHMMSVFRKDPAVFSAQNINRIDAVFDETPCTTCKFDVEMMEATKPKYYEFKSYQYKSIVNLDNQLNQFKMYLSSVNNWDEFRYVFNKLKKHDVDLLRKEFQKFMAKNATEIYNANPLLMKKFIMPDGLNVDIIDDFERLVKTPNFYEQLTFIETW